MESGTGRPVDVSQVRLFDPQGSELTLHTGLIDDEMLLVEVRLYAPDGHQLGEIAGGVDFALCFTPDSLATSAPVSGQPLQRIVTPTAIRAPSRWKTEHATPHPPPGLQELPQFGCPAERSSSPISFCPR